MDSSRALCLIVTLGTWATEPESEAAFDSQVERSGLFTILRQVRGELLQPRFGQQDKGIRIDRILEPTPKLLALGWAEGPIGIEIKCSNVKVKPAFAQALDYSRSAWQMPDGKILLLKWVFVWPTPKFHGTCCEPVGAEPAGHCFHVAVGHVPSAQRRTNHSSHRWRLHCPGQPKNGNRTGSR